MADKSEQVPALRSWGTAQTLEDLGELTALWLLGEVPECPTQGGPPDAETAEIIQALVECNRRGFVTEFSQPGKPLRDGSGQRAAVSGYAPEPLAKKLFAASLHSDLVVLIFQPGAEGGYSIPVTADVFHPYTRVGCFCGELAEEFCRHLGPLATLAVLTAWYVAVIDPSWGRRDYLWHTLLKALREPESERFFAEPWPAEGKDSAEFTW